MREMKNNDGFVPGMLTNMNDIKILICYLLNSLKEPIEKEQMIEMIFENEIAPYFDLRAAVMELVESGSITEDKEGNLLISEAGTEVAEQLESALPYTAREKVVNEGIRISTLSKRKKDSKTEILKENGSVFLKCELLDGESEVLSFKILVADEFQAELLEKRFVENPALIYKKFLSSLLG